MALPDHYATLGVLPNATEVSVKKAYRRLVLRFHPDRNPGNRAAEEQFKKVVLAYETLSRADKRADYDAQWKSAQRSQQDRAADSMRRQQAGARPSPRKTAARRSPLAYVTYRSNEFDRRDVIQGLVWGGVFLVAFGSPWSAVGWAVLPVLGGFVGLRVGAWSEDQWEPLLVRVTIGGPLAYTLLPLLAPAAVLFGACTLTSLAQYVWRARILTEGMVGASLAAGLGAAVGAGFGRAFTSVAERLAAKCAGMVIGMLFGAVSGGLLGMFLAANRFGRWLDHGNYDSILPTILAAAVGAALASAYGSFRPD